MMDGTVKVRGDNSNNSAKQNYKIFNIIDETFKQ